MKKLRRNRTRENLRKFRSFCRSLLELLSVSTFWGKGDQIFELGTFIICLKRILAILRYLPLFRIILGPWPLHGRLRGVKALSLRFLLNRLLVASQIIRTPSLDSIAFLGLKLNLILIDLHFLDVLIGIKHNLINI